MQHAYKHTHDVTLVCGATNKQNMETYGKPMETYGDLWRPMETNPQIQGKTASPNRSETSLG